MPTIPTTWEAEVGESEASWPKHKTLSENQTKAKKGWGCCSNDRVLALSSNPSAGEKIIGQAING
jgi:hypothetical protein